MTLAVERHDGDLWLVAYDAPGDASCTLLAQFNDAHAVAVYKAAVARTMGFAREVGRSGLG